MKRLLFALSILLLVACGKVEPDVATRVLTNTGHTDIQLGTEHVSGCNRDENYSLGFAAKGPTGRPVRGILCATSDGGVTIRYH